MTHIIDDVGAVYKVDRLARTQNTQRVRKFSFGDGYEQRVPDGINTLNQSFNVNFVNRPEAEAEALIDFFETKSGVDPFALSVPGAPFASANVTFLASPDRLSYNSGTNFAGLYADDWILVSGSASSDLGYAVDKGQSNTDTLLYLYNGIGSTESSVAVTVHKAIGVICETWNVVYPNEGVITINATLRRVYEP
jgi:phage-related protein